MNVLQKALDEVKFSIPPEILQHVFIDRVRQYRYTPTSIDSQIMELVIRPRVMVDANLVGGREVYIPLDGIVPDMNENYNSIYRIPKKLTQGCSIISVKNITFADPTFLSSAATIANMGASSLLYAGQSVMDAFGMIPTVSSSTVQLIGENVILVRDNNTLPPNCYIRCIIGNDDQLSHIQMRSYLAFADLAVLAVKAYIYINRVVAMDRGIVEGGQDIGAFKETIEEYKDANELYRTYLREKWTKIAFMNDRETLTRYLKRQIGANR